MDYNLLMLALIAGLVVTQVFTIVNPGLAAALKSQVQERMNNRIQNTPKARRELLEYAVSTAYYAVEQFRKTEVFKRALAAADKLTEQDLLKQETLKRAKQILLVMGVEVPDDGLLMSVLDTLVERLVREDNKASAIPPIVQPQNLMDTQPMSTDGIGVSPEQKAAIDEAIRRFEAKTGLNVVIEDAGGHAG